MRPHLIALLASLPLFSACGGPIEEGVPPVARSTGESSQALAVRNGIELNGPALNGGSLNGGSLNGNALSGFITKVRHSHVLVPGYDAPVDVHVQGPLFSRGATVFSNPIGMTFTGELEDGRPVQLRIQGFSPGTGANWDLPQLDVAYFEPTSGLWRPACVDAAGHPVRAIPVLGRWDYRVGVHGGGSFIHDDASFTFACLSGAVGKCILAGYRPWTKVNGKSTEHYLEACTRALRADFCGDGRSWTQNGRRVNLYDRLGIQTDTESWALESYWGKDGAICFSSANRSLSPVPCYNPNFETTCTATDVPKEALLAIELP